MELVGSALLHNSDYATGRVSVLRGQGRSQNLHFFNRVLDWFDHRCPGGLLIAVDAIFEDADRAIALSGEMIRAKTAAVPIAAHGKPRNEIQGEVDIALVERQFVKRFPFNHGASGGRLSLKQGRRPSYLHRVRDESDLELHVHGQYVARTQLNSVAHELLKTGSLEANAVGTGRKRGNPIETLLICDCRELEIRFRLHNRNADSRDNRASRVSDAAGDRRTTDLGAAQRCESSKGKKEYVVK